jgi:hypothetical protein
VEAVKGTCKIPSFTWEWPASDVLAWLTPVDQQLAQVWAERERGEAEKHVARMLSARAAEKVAIQFYRQFSLRVKDVSITQLQNDQGEWKQYDLVAGLRPIDVKNARVPFNNRQTYVDHCVPRFKQDSQRRDVTIAAVVSPWISRDQFQGKRSLRPDVVPLRFIGETNRSTVERLEQRFADLAAHAATNLALVQAGDGSRQVLPPWLFDYPDFVYKLRNRSRHDLLRLSENELPSIDDLELLGANPLPAFLGAKRRLHHSWFPLISSWQLNFYNRVQDHPEPLSLPALFLHLLLHFLEVSRTTVGHSDYSPKGYRKLLYVDAAGGRRPAGIVDPLSIIDTLIKALTILWDNRHDIRLHDFQSFRFRGVGILAGRRKGIIRDEEEVRILAYCGGEIWPGVKCGHTPLLIGQEETCDGLVQGKKCGYLICSKCQFCQDGCSAQAKRNMSRSPPST